MSNIVPSSAPQTPVSTVPSGVFVSYAQNCEDVMLRRALRDVERGCYIDVGAAEPIAESVTYAFYLRGWRGVNIEPVVGPFERLCAARPDDINLNLAAGDRDGTISFFLVDGGNGLSTAVEDQAAKLNSQGWSSVETQVEMQTLSSIVDRHVQGPVHFLKVDVEGAERAVLAGANLRNFRPWIILVEATEPNSKIPTHQAWEDLLLEANYQFVWFDGLNRFYVAAEKSEIAAAFDAPPNVFDGYVRRSEADASDQLAKLHREFTEQQSRNQMLDEELGRVAREATGQLDQISALEATVASQRDQISALEVAAAGQRDQISVLEVAAAGQRDQRSALEAEVARISAEVARISIERDNWAQELFESDRHAAHLTLERQRLAEENMALYSERGRLTEENGALLQESGTLRQENGTLRHEDGVLRQRIAAVYASTSWRVSWPVRAVARLLGRR